MRRPYQVALLLAAALLIALAAVGMGQSRPLDAAPHSKAPHGAPTKPAPQPCAITAFGTRLCGTALHARCTSLRQGWWNHTTHHMEYRYPTGAQAACVATDRWAHAAGNPTANAEPGA